MKSVIVYYSYTGNTRKVAEILAEYLESKAETTLIALKTLDESDKFLSQALRAFIHTRARLEPTDFNLSNYDLICFGSPVWAFAPAPAINTYIDRCFGINQKPVVLFTTYGSGVGNQRCLDYMQSLLIQKGVSSFKRFSIQQFKTQDKEFILSQIRSYNIDLKS
ncbi:MAG: NAD(P)H-dependent oxidoreductase [Candidatus Omnitrophica bacterium]|nr:NAD(P)H-dependent oxidoreductase [Candidatus Omnitrophota bacterium]